MEAYERLEREIEAWSGMPHAVVCSSGTAALHLALEALRLPMGSEVVVPDFAMIAVPRAVAMAGHRPVFVDCGERLLMDCGLIWKFMEEGNDGGYRSKIRAIMLVHIYGRTCDEKLWDPASALTNTPVIEDLAEAHGVQPNRRTDAACWSFYRNKVVAGEEGGAVAFRRKEYADLARCLRSQGFTEAHDFWHVPRGCNYRLSNANAELIRYSFTQLDASLTLRRGRERLCDEACPAEWKMPPRNVPWVYDFRVPGLSWKDQDAVIAALHGAGIEARHGFKPNSMQEEFRDCRLVTQASARGLSSSAILSAETIYLPLNRLPRPRAAFDTVHRVLSEIRS